MGSEPGKGGRREGGRGGGPGPKFLAECCAHTPYLAQPCLRSRESAALVGREGGQHPQKTPQLQSLPPPCAKEGL